MIRITHLTNQRQAYGWLALCALTGLAIILAGLVMPIGHGSLRFLTRKNRKEH